MPAQTYGRSVYEDSGVPATDAFVITPGSSEFTFVTRGIYVGGAGDIQVITADGTTITFVGVLAGSILPIKARAVLAGSTTATNLVGLI